jgi:putative oligomerization/nucleic acid binding protein
MLGKPSRRTRRKLEQHGRRASAMVVEIAESGMSISSGQLVSGTELVLKTKLRIEPLDEPPFEVEDRFRYPQLAIPSVGSRIAVIYDPSDHDKVMIDRSAGGPGVQPGAAAEPRGNDPQALASKIQEAQSLARDARERAGGGFGAPTPTAQGEDPVDKLAKLAELREKGMLTDAEFESQKARILGES